MSSIVKFTSVLSLIFNITLSMGQSAIELNEYVEFIKKQNTQPADFVLNEFSKGKRFIVICERDHGETTQYQLFSDIVSDARFDSVRNIFTEVGSSTLRDYYNELSSREYSDAEIEHRIDSIYKNLMFYPYWEKSNFYDFLLKIQLLNKSNASKRYIYFSDLPFSWENMSPVKYKDFIANTLPRRDSIMASQIISKIQQLDAENNNKTKALIILNYRHGFGNVFYNGVKVGNCGAYLKDAFGDKISFIYLNTIGIKSMEEPGKEALIQYGAWDAAFKICNKKTLAFDLKNSPFGNCSFDLYPYFKDNLKYSDVFDGFIFYLPLADHHLCYELPHLFDNEFKNEYLRRVKIAGYGVFSNKIYLLQIKLIGKHCNKYETLKQQNKQINKIIKDYYKR